MARGNADSANEWVPVELLPKERVEQSASGDDASEAAAEIAEQLDPPEDGEVADEAAAVEHSDEAAAVEHVDAESPVEPSPPPPDTEIGRLVERAERAKSAIREAEASTEGAGEEARLETESDALRRLADAEEKAREAALVADRLAAKVVALTDRLGAQEEELERLREETGAAGAREHEDEPRSHEQRPQPSSDGQGPDLQRDVEMPPLAADGAEPQAAPDQQEPQRARDGQRPQHSPDEREPRLDLNGATFEQLCRLGLSVHQAARLIGKREHRGGFSSLGELDQLNGLSRETIDTLKRATRV